MSIYQRLLRIAERRGAGFLVLLDPDEYPKVDLIACAERAEDGGADALLLGGSLVRAGVIDNVVREIKQRVTLPVITFPGDAGQLTRYADAVLFMSLLSGRNPEYLIGEQVKGAPLVKEYDLEAISTAYLLIESGSLTSVQHLSQTQPLPRNKPELVKAHALAAQYFGMKLVYLEAGSGARYAVPEEIVTAVCEHVSLPIICGGGLRNPKQAAARVEAGASFVVIGNRFQESDGLALLAEFADAIHQGERARTEKI
ncbi:MAG: geranylgeranylglyceryl/heptaprenylglyceryl phosphate synthase [bacterium]